MTIRWDYLEDVRFILQESPKSNRFSRLSIRNLFSSNRSQNGQTQTSERSHERVSVWQPRGRAPVLQLRLSEFNASPILRGFRTPSHSPSSLQIHLIPETPPGPTTGGFLDVLNPSHRKVPFDAPTSPLSPNSPWTTTGSPPNLNVPTNKTAGPQSWTPIQDERDPHLTHTREDTASSTLSHLQVVEVMSLSESPPDPGFVLPIPSRSRKRRGLDSSPDDLMLIPGPTYPTRTSVSDVHYCTNGTTVLIWDNLY
jgi:hypothetical protein